MFETLLNDSEVSKFIINYRKIDSNNKFCRGNILGLNVGENGQILSEKFYFSTTFYLTKQQILYFLPTEEHLTSVYRFADFSDDAICKRGVTFAIKKTRNGIIRQFHFKVPAIYYNSPAMAKHKIVYLPDQVMTGDEVYGIAYEYRGQEGHLKNYVYLKNNMAKEYFSDLLNTKIQCDVIEYTESRFGSKVILLNTNDCSYKHSFPKLPRKLIYKNYGTYLTTKEYSAYIYPKNYAALEKKGEIDTLSLL